MEKKGNDKNQDRRDFLRKGLLISGGVVVGGSLIGSLAAEQDEKGEKVNVMTADGQMVQVDSTKIESPTHCNHSGSTAEARIGIAGKKWVMVIDLSRCKNALKCQDACNAAHHLSGPNQWLHVYKMQDNDAGSPYWMPKPCLHCDNPPCTKVCPVDATYKRSDGIVLVDNERCIGCRFCMAACPYSTRVFNWDEPKQPASVAGMEHDPETSLPSQMGTVSKCDFCPDMLKHNKLPHCVTACPNGVFFMGDENEDAVTNGSETYVLSELLRDKAGYRYMEELGTKPRVYYLPPVDRLFPFEDEEANAEA